MNFGFQEEVGKDYLNKGLGYHSMAPRVFTNALKGSVNTIISNGDTSASFTSVYTNVAPVINLNDYFIEKMVGDGTSTNLFRLSDN